MHNIQIKTKVITNKILNDIREHSCKAIQYTGVVRDIVKGILSDESELDTLLEVEWDSEKRPGVCPFTPEQLLELAPYGFNACPMERFVSGELDLRTAIEFCFQQTFFDAWDERNWEDELSKDFPEFGYDLFQIQYESGTKEEWLATDEEGKPLRELFPHCREKAKGKKPELKIIKN